MRSLKEDLAAALESLEAGEEDRAHELIEEHREKAMRMRKAVEQIEQELDAHLDHLDELADRTERFDTASIRNTVDELRDAMDEDSHMQQVLGELEGRFEADGS